MTNDEEQRIGEAYREISELKEQLALTEKALELACICVANKMPIEMKSVKWWVKYFIKKAGE